MFFISILCKRRHFACTTVTSRTIGIFMIACMIIMTELRFIYKFFFNSFFSEKMCKSFNEVKIEKKIVLFTDKCIEILQKLFLSDWKHLHIVFFIPLVVAVNCSSLYSLSFLIHLASIVYLRTLIEVGIKM